MPAQDLEILGLKQALVADLHRIIPTFRHALEKQVERRDEIPATLPVAGTKMGKLEDDRANPVTVRRQRSQKFFRE